MIVTVELYHPTKGKVYARRKLTLCAKPSVRDHVLIHGYRLEVSAVLIAEDEVVVSVTHNSEVLTLIASKWNNE